MPFIREVIHKRKSGKEVTYIQIVHSYRVGKKVKQKIIGTLGRKDQLLKSGSLERLAYKLLEIAGKLEEFQNERKGMPNLFLKDAREMGRAYLFKYLWKKAGLHNFFRRVAEKEGLSFDLSEAIYEMVLNRITEPTSKRRLFMEWREEHDLGDKGLELHHYYRALDYLVRVKRALEDYLYMRGRDLFSGPPKVAFFDTTSTYFEGEGPEGLAEYGYSKDKRPDRKQVVIGVVLGEGGLPIYHNVWEGSQMDLVSFRGVLRELRERWGLEEVIWVADRGCVSPGLLEVLDKEGIKYVVGVKMRKEREVRDEVLSRGGRYREMDGGLKVKEVRYGGYRYVVCYDPMTAERDRRVREEIIKSLEDGLKGKGMGVIQKGYRRYLKKGGGGYEIDRERVEKESRYDGKWVLRTNVDLETEEVVRVYKDLWKVERAFRDMKDVLRIRPIYHWKEERVRGHITVCFLALYLMQYLEFMMGEEKGEVGKLMKAMRRLKVGEVELNGKMYRVRTEVDNEVEGMLGRIGLKLPPLIRAM